MRERSPLFRQKYISNSPALIFFENNISFWPFVYPFFAPLQINEPIITTLFLVDSTQLSCLDCIFVASGIHFALFFSFYWRKWIWCLWGIGANRFQEFTRNITKANRVAIMSFNLKEMFDLVQPGGIRSGPCTHKFRKIEEQTLLLFSTLVISFYPMFSTLLAQGRDTPHTEMNNKHN